MSFGFDVSERDSRFLSLLFIDMLSLHLLLVWTLVNLDAQGRKNKAEAGWITVTSHLADGVDAQDVKALGHDGGRGFAEQHPPHVDLYHLTWRERRRFHR